MKNLIWMHCNLFIIDQVALNSPVLLLSIMLSIPARKYWDLAMMKPMITTEAGFMYELE